MRFQPYFLNRRSSTAATSGTNMIKQSHVCDGCEKVQEQYLNARRLTIRIDHIPTKDWFPAMSKGGQFSRIHAVKDACSHECFLRILADQVLNCQAMSRHPIETKRSVSVDELDLSIRAANWCARHDVQTAAQLAEYDFSELGRLERPNKNMIRNMSEELSKHGLKWTYMSHEQLVSNTGITEPGYIVESGSDPNPEEP